MFLKTLQIKGFKSFAETATLSLEPGVTVVVGPNGSGKSNVVDAIGWVLGAQRPSSVRSTKMDDVIFAGTAKRAALGRAEVSLTIDNSAGLLPIEFTEVTITRLLFRTGDSEYSINGVPCRLLDIQDLLSDSGVGKQQHVIISQGNIDAVLNARPEERRLIIEEAAGVLKYRRRKERAERRLSATEANLTRVQDLLREVRRQLRPLERQAEAARRHGDLVEELNVLRLHLRGRELKRLRSELEVSAGVQTDHRASDQRLRMTLRDLDSRIVAAEAKLGSLGGRDVGGALVRYEKLSEKARGLTALLAERRRGIERELDVSVDLGVIASLESEQARLRSEMIQIDSDATETMDASEELRATEHDLAVHRSDFEIEWGDGVIAPTGEAAGIRGELDALRGAIERTQADENRLETRRLSLSERLNRLDSEREMARSELDRLTASESTVHDQVQSTITARVDTEGHLEGVERLATSFETDYSAWVARSEALTMALDEARQRAGAEHLADLDGVLGTLLDLVDVDPGWEDAFEAAAGEALDAVVVSRIEVAERALAALKSGDHSGAVLALEAVSASTPPRSTVGEPVRGHVRALAASGTDSASIERLLDQLVGGAVLIDGGWREAVGVAKANPDSVVISREGDRLGPRGWRLGGNAAGATGAALEDALRRAEAAQAERDLSRDRLEKARSALTEARKAEQDAIRARDGLESSLKSLKDSLNRLDADRSEAEAELSSLVAHVGELSQRLGRSQARVEELEALLPELEASERALGERARVMAQARRELESRSATVSGQRTDLEVRAAAIDERRRYVVSRLSQIDERLERNRAERDAAAARRVELTARADATELLVAFVAARAQRIDSNLSVLREEQRRQSDEARSVTSQLESMRSDRQRCERELETVRAYLQKAEIADAETRLRLEAVIEAVRGELNSEPETAEMTMCPSLPEGVSASARLRELERELRLLGPINPLALQEFTELSQRNSFLEGQLDDIRATRRELSKVIRAVEEEIVNVFTSGFADVSENFSLLFETLFPGGQGRLRLTDPNNLLETGIEIEAKPSGKNVRKLSLLSGGERSLTALAYLFAVFRSRPSPFYVMDEVEAALDDVNLHRFLDLIKEFRQSAQLIIVSHQKRTMEAADVLYGVTMEPAGSSKVVSEKASSAV